MGPSLLYIPGHGYAHVTPLDKILYWIFTSLVKIPKPYNGLQIPTKWQPPACLWSPLLYFSSLFTLHSCCSGQCFFLLECSVPKYPDEYLAPPSSILTCVAFFMEPVLMIDKIANHFYFIHKHFIPLTLGCFFFKHLLSINIVDL